MLLPRLILPLLSALLCFVFAGLLAGQWRTRRRPYQLVWALGLLFYALASGSDAAGQWFGWNQTTYRVWYIFGAVAAAAWLGVGELYLMRTSAFGELVAFGVFAGAIPAMIRAGRLLGALEDQAAQTALTVGLLGIVAAGLLALCAWEKPSLLGHAALAIVAAGSLAAAVMVLSAPVDVSQMVDPTTGIPHGAALPENVRLITPLFNIGGALALLFGAAYSTWSFWRSGRHRERMVSNCLITLGAFAPSLTGSLNRFGLTGLFYWGELFGVLLIFGGFLASTEVFARRHGRRPAVRVAPPAAASGAA